MNNIPLKRTINLMKNQNVDKIRVKMDFDNEKPEEKALDIPEQIMDQI